MNLLRLFQLQETLDNRILTQHDLNRGELFPHKILALLVELGELANETRCFKYWSTKPSSPMDKVLEEYVDGVHFILSLGIDHGFNDLDSIGSAASEVTDVTGQFLRVFQTATEFLSSRERPTYVKLLHEYLVLGRKLGFQPDDIEQAYLLKNEVNHERQNHGY